MKKLVIRKTQDIEIIKQLHTKTLPGDEFYSHPGNVYWILWAGSKPVGFCMLTIWEGRIVFLSRSGIMKMYRGKGLHKRMIRIRERYCRENNFNHLITYTTKDNYNSFLNLTRMGYKFYDPEYAYAGKDMFYLIKTL